MKKCKYSVNGECKNDEVAGEKCNSTELEMKSCTPFQRSIILHDDIWDIEVEEEIDSKETQKVGCECCLGDEALYWQDNENNAFIDSKGEIFVTAHDRCIHFNVEFCPNCGREF